jgi:hypothetical protein
LAASALFWWLRELKGKAQVRQMAAVEAGLGRTSRRSSRILAVRQSRRRSRRSRCSDMWQWLASFLTAPIINGFISAYKAKLDAGNTKDRIAVDLAARELAVEQREAEVNTQYNIAMIGHWYEPTRLLGYIMVVYVGK